MSDAWFGPGKKGLPPRRVETPAVKVDLHKLVADQFVCFKCSRPAPVHVWLNGQLWNEIKNPYAQSGEGGVLCLYCMSERLTAMGYKDGAVGLTISNGPFCNMKWDSITKPYEDEIAALKVALAQGTSAFGQDPQGLEAKPAGPVVEDHAPEPCTQTHTTKKKGE